MTSDKRIEIAERMRGPFDVCECVGHTYLSGTLFGMQVCARDELALRNGMRYLADLIDPTCHVDVNEHGRAYCTNCGCDDWCLADGSPFCPNCGCRCTYEEVVDE